MSDTETSISEFNEQGFAIVKGFVPPSAVARLNARARSALSARIEPLELEADLKYPGAPPSREAIGGGTVRRLLGAFDRDPVFAEWARSPRSTEWLNRYFNEPVLVSRAHHNCVMTKHPRYGSLTGWHRDARYWSFARAELVSVWMALGEERVDNGGLWFIPGSHRMPLADERFDAAKFFRANLPDNDRLIKEAVSPVLGAGDAVFFHCNTLHSAGRNESGEVKLSLVFTYHAQSNRPHAGTRSAAMPEVPLI
jgi:phytanoyl-CoA hydroxylase